METNIFFSATTLSFYDENLKDKYVENNNWPSDAVKITKAQHDEFSGQSPVSKVLGAVGALPSWIDVVINPSQLALSQIFDLESTVTDRRQREAILTTDGRSWLQSVEDQIVVLRSSLA